MADNVILNAGSGGAVIATDDVLGVHFPISKMAFGALDSVTLVSAAAGLPAAQQGTWTISLSQYTPVSGRLPVDGSGVTQPVSVAAAVTVAQSTAANLNCTEASAASIKTAVEIMDDWDETDRCKVNPIAGQAGVAAGSGTVGATTQRVVLATDVALPVGTNRIGAAYPVCGQVVDENGNVLTVKRKAAVVSSSGNNAFISAVSNKKIRVLAYRLQASGTVTVKFYDTQGGTPAQVANSPQWDFQAREGVSASSPPGAWEFETAGSGTNDGLQINLSAAIAVMAHVIYVEV